MMWSDHIDRREADWPKGLYRRSNSYRFRKVVHGRQIIEVWGRISLLEALHRATRYNFDIEEGREPDFERARREITVAGFARDVWLRKKATEVRPKSLARYRAVVEHFIEYLEQVRGLHAPVLGAVGYELASDYVVHRASTPIMPNGHKKYTRAIRSGASKKTVHCERETLFQMFGEAVRRELIKQNPFAGVRPKKPSVHEVAAVHHPLTVEEEAALLHAAGDVDRARADKGNPSLRDMVLFMVRTGLREDEMRHLEWTDIDWREECIQVRQKRVEVTRTMPIPESVVPNLRRQLAGKGPDDPVFQNEEDITAFRYRLYVRRKPDMLAIKAGEVDVPGRRIVTRRSYMWQPKGTNGVVPMCMAVRELLARLAERKTCSFVFPHQDGGPFRIKLLPMLKRAQNLAGIAGNLRVHDLRHTLAVRLRREKGVPLETIMGILRHADIRETLIYAPYSIDEGRAAMRRLDEEVGTPSPQAEFVPDG